MASPQSVVGQTLGHFRILEAIGAGGMGEVYRARDEQLHREVAVKILPAATFNDGNARARLLREARTASQLNHPNICTIYEVGEDQGRAYIAMELVGGQPLSVGVAAGPLNTDDLLQYATQIADAVGHAHGKGVVHRDLKSANVMVTPEGRVKVLDFGLAKRLEGELGDATRSQPSLTQAGTVMGTLAYMAPEQLRGRAADTRSDVWAMGIMLHEMATGHLPFEGQTAFELTSAILNQAPAPLPSAVPAELRAVVDCCLEKDPARRYQTAGELRAALEAIQSGTTAPWTTVRYRLRRKRWATAAIATFVLLAVTAVLNLDRIHILLGGGPRVQSLAVLPLANLSGDAQQEYFADGMTESLITDLRRLTGLKRVIARGSVMRYKGSNKPLSEIARELKVDALITGSVTRSGSRVRITAQLIDPQSETQTWSENYEREASDILRLQDEITKAIAGAIRMKLTASEQVHLARAGPVNPEAHDAYLQGRFYWQKIWRGGPQLRQELDTAERYFQLALTKDPNYALAYTGLGIVWGQRCVLGVLPCREALPKWKQAVSRALELDPASPEAQAQAAAIAFYLDWNWTAAGQALQRAIEREPNYPEAHVWYAYWLFSMGRPEEGLAETRQALALDPYNPLYKWYLGDALYKARHNDEAIAYLRRLVEEDPKAPRPRNTLRFVFEQKQMYSEAWEQWQQALTASGDEKVTSAVEKAYAEGGYPRAMRVRADLAVERSPQQRVEALQIAQLYASAGEKELAVDWLEKAFQEHEFGMVYVAANPRFDLLRDHPRFQSLLRRMNLRP